MNLEKLCSQVCEIVRETGDFIRKESLNFDRSSVEFKSFNALVSYVDTSAEKQLVENLGKLLPEAGFITEEETISTDKKELSWVIDPLDGTTNFVHAIPAFAVSVALMKDDEVIIGVVYEISRDEMFYAWKDSVAFLNGNEILASKVTSLEQSLIATGFPYQDFEGMQNYLDVLVHLMKNTQGLRRLGSASVDLVYVACGKFEAYFEYGLSSWDVAGGILIAKRAGVQIADFSGGNNYIFGGEIIASCPGIYSDFLELIKTSFNKE
ncbi:MAG: inositol monophosphatase [Bacteroidia bacterium]|nr:inositol monophosphatase [Bacteroidia bacterium]